MKEQNEKQAIEKMARIIHGTPFSDMHRAVALYNAGYRRQSVGEWVKVINHKECSKCGYNAPYKKIKRGYHLLDLTNFCPNCGARMKGGA